MNKYSINESRKYNDRLKAMLSGGVHYNFRTFGKEAPRHFVKGSGSRLWDMDENEYLDLYAKFGAAIVGHNNVVYNELLKEQLSLIMAINHSGLDLEASEAVLSCFPSMDRIRFGLSGTEIVQNALRIARAYSKRQKIIRFNGHYHGNSDNIMGGTSTLEGGYRPIDFIGDPRGTLGRATGTLEQQTYLLPWNDIDVLESFLIKEYENIAAIIMEPICINGGGIYPVSGYLERVRELCTKYGIVLIFDEIITGFRLCFGGAQKILGVTPDLTVLGKAMAGGGLPVSAIIGKKEIMSLYDDQNVVHAGTFNGYVLGLAAVVATLKILSANNHAVYDSMALISKKISEVFIKAAKEQNFDLVLQGPATALSYHCVNKAVIGTHDLSGETILKDSILNRSLADFGILISPISRLYMNVLFNDSDVEFFRNRVAYALQDAAETINEVLCS